MAEAGVFHSHFQRGGEIFLRKIFFEILECAPRSYVLASAEDKCGADFARRRPARLRDLGVQSVQISIYSHRPEVMTRSPR